MSERGAEGILKRRQAEAAAAREAAAEAEVGPGEQYHSVGETPSRTERTFGAINRHQREANYRTGLNDPRLSVWLYLSLVVTSIMFNPIWGKVTGAVAGSAKAAGTKAVSGR